MSIARYLALDLGAESGRVVVGTLEKGRLHLEEIHRFPNGPVRLLDTLHWDALQQFREIKAGIAQYVSRYGAEVGSLGIDTWGVDFGLLGRGDVLLGNPVHYRDARTDGMMEAAFAVVPREEVFQRTGIQFMQLNTLFQLVAMVRQRSPLLEAAETLLLMPDLLHFWLTGVKASEFSIATTSQCYDPRAGDWARGMLEALGIPSRIFQEVRQPGTAWGPLLPSVAEETGLKQGIVVAPGTHDTASAVAGVPSEGDDHAYLSSGTWSLMGVETRQPVINERSLAYNFTNEGGVGGTYRLLRNIMGLWLVQECRREWARAGSEYSYDEITQMAAEAEPMRSLVDPDRPEFLSPGGMPARIQAVCREAGEPVPETPGALVRCALESLALKYRWVLERLEELSSKKLSVIHVVGGGSQNRLLCQFAANATQRPVIAGPVEATAIGNVLTQALAGGAISSLQEGRRIVASSFEMSRYEPQDAGLWDDAYGRLFGGA
ncbi:MAG TPA: rhamnulokinase family protein [Armatimonadota bacterium]|jgi:rhamnulokinase